MATESDAAETDGATTDAAATDAGRLDATEPDAAKADGATTDAAATDAGRLDATEPVAAKPDAATTDAAATDVEKPNATDVVSLADPTSVACRLALAIVRATLEVLESQGCKALPLTVVRCRTECHELPVTSVASATALTFHVVEFKTNYDFTKIARLQVDAENTQEVVDPTDEDRCVLRAVPVILQPASQGVKLIFAYVYKKRAELVNWSLINARGEQVTMLSTVMATGRRGTQQYSMIISPGSPAVVLAGACPKVERSEARVEAENEEGCPERATSGPAQSSTSLPRLQAIWATMPFQERVLAMTFGQSVRSLAVRCRAAVSQLHEAARRSAELGLYAGLSGFTLVSSLEFVPEPGGKASQPLAMTFGPELVSRGDLWAVLEKALPGWLCSAQRKPMPHHRWDALFVPMPTSWAQLEAAIAALLEQRFFALLQRVEKRVQDAAERIDHPIASAQRAPATAAHRLKRSSVRRQQSRGLTSGSGTKSSSGSAVLVATEDADQAADAEEDDERGSACHGEDSSPESSEEVLEPFEPIDADVSGGGPGEERASDVDAPENAIDPEGDVAAVRLEATGASQDTTWQTVGPRRRRRKGEADAGRLDASLESDMPTLDPAGEDKAPAGPEEPGLSPEELADGIVDASLARPIPQAEAPEAACNELARHTDEASVHGGGSCPAGHAATAGDTALRRSGSDPMMRTAALDDGETCVTMPGIEQLARMWQSSVMAAEACTDWAGPRESEGRGWEFHQTRRKENASWRLWHIQTSQVQCGQKAPLHGSLETESYFCTCGCGLGGICTCQPDPWQPLGLSEAFNPYNRFSSPSSHSDSNTRSSSDRFPEAGHLPPGLCTSAAFVSPDHAFGGLPAAGTADFPGTDGLCTPWRPLLRGTPAVLSNRAVGSHAEQAAHRRQKNAVWRRWHQFHQADRLEPQYVQTELFPPTPTSTFPGTPTTGTLDFPSAFQCDLPPLDPEHHSAFAAPSSSQVVFLPVPLCFATEVQSYIARLVAAANEEGG